MKQPLFFSFILLTISIAHSQTTVSDSVSIGSDNMAFYSLANGEAANVNGKNWDIQISTKHMDAPIRINDAAGVMLYSLQNPDTANWASFALNDTASMTPLHNSDTSWDAGAFNVLSTGMFDYGWGQYCNCPTHEVTGKRIFVIRTINGVFKKIWIRNLANDDAYQFKISNLDNSGDTTVILRKSDYPSKTSFYYAIEAGEVKDIEPAQNLWDLVFAKYYSLDTNYLVTGVLAHSIVSVAEARGVDVSSNDYSAYSFSGNISEIGYDWKSFSMTTGYTIEDMLAYFVQAQDSNIYKLVFTGYGGGKFHFDKTSLPASTSVSEISNIRTLTIYPNPAVDKIQAIFSMQQDAGVTLRILDLSGKSHLTTRTQAHSGLNVLTLNAAELAQGSYLLTVDDGNNSLTYKFVRN